MVGKEINGLSSRFQEFKDRARKGMERLSEMEICV